MGIPSSSDLNLTRRESLTPFSSNMTPDDTFQLVSYDFSHEQVVMKKPKASDDVPKKSLKEFMDKSTSGSGKWIYESYSESKEEQEE